MRGVIIILLLVGLSFAGFFRSEVDYFNESRTESEKKEEEKKDYYEKIWEETQNWFPQNVSPLERELYKNPTDPVLQNMYVKYLEQRTQRARFIGTMLQERFRAKEETLKTLGNAGVKIYYFYSPTCPYCQISNDTAMMLSRYVKIHRLNVDIPNPAVQELVARFGVDRTPTLVAMDGNGNPMDVWVGAFTWDNLLFHKWLMNLARMVSSEEEG